MFVLETWRTMTEKEVHVDHKSYILIFRALCKGGYLDQAFNMMKTLENNDDFAPTLPLYNNILGGCALVKSVDHAKKCLDLMHCHLVGKDEITYTLLLKLAVLQQNLSAVHSIWDEYVRYYSPSIISLRKFVWSFTKLKDLRSAYNSLQAMVNLALMEGRLATSRLDIPIPSNCDSSMEEYNHKDSKHEVSVFSNPVKIGVPMDDNADTVISCQENIQMKGANLGSSRKHKLSYTMKLLRWSFNDLLHSCAQTSNSVLAEQLLFQMQNIGLEPSSSSYDGFIRAVVSNAGTHSGHEALNILQQKNLKPHDSTIAAIVVQCCKEMNLDLAEYLLNQISTKSHVYPYNAFLEACDALDRPECAIRMLAKMKQIKIQPDIKTYELLFSLFGNVNAPYEEGNILSQVDVAKRINLIEVDMSKNGIPHTLSSVKNLLKALGAEGMTSDLIHYLRLAEHQFYSGDYYLRTTVYNVVLHSLVEAKESDMAIEMFTSMRSDGFLLDAATYNIMIDCCSTIRCFRSACSLLSLMMRDGFAPVNVTYTALIKILLRNKDFDEALKLLDQANLDEIQYDVLLFNTILDEACDKERLDIIEVIIERMHRAKVQPDASTCNSVFSAYINYGFISTAMEALQVLSMRMISYDESVIESKKIEFEENFIFLDDEDAESRIIDLFKSSTDNIAVALLNLRWCAILGYHISWVPSQSPWTRRLSTNYNC
ncbi:pentatricopeptide repeat-containing protein At1g76280 isoform X2 [Impatiens glandulifera]|uniref:pentatricopeptide repeat-containing protein At1g76280 isoform X2 n=1 Tax=Impatiens glandulifera TaxID=253017 RepID=UPI001FB0B333|nr:pentatricopeptide repeat-containing protein At1g76280 isoform X2 [Impatiens glandulifera]